MKKIFLTLSLFCVTMVSAQMKLTLSDAVDLALSENPTIKIANMEIERFDYVKRATWGNLLPQISASSSYSFSAVKAEIAEGVSFGADNTIALAGDISLPLYAPSVYRTLRMNETELEAAVESARSSRITLVAEVKKSFYNILLAEQSLVVLRESESTIKRTVDDTKLQYDNGLASEYDYLTAQVQLSNLQPTILQTKNSIQIAKRLLKMYLSIPEDVGIGVIGELDAMRDEVLNGAESLSTETSENTDLRKLDIQADLLRDQLRVSNASRLPTVSAFGNITYSGNDLDRGSLGGIGGGAAPPPSSSNLYWQNPLNVGVRVSIPIFSGLTKTNKARQINNSIAQIEMQRDYAQKSVDVQLRSSINNLMTARETMFSQELTVKQATKAYSISDTRYRAGAGTILELNTAQLSQTQAQLNFSQAIFDFLTAKAEYDKIVGKEDYKE